MPEPSPLPESVRRVDADAPWLGLLSFTEETQRFFFGRDAEVRELFLRVRDHPLTVLYSQSGLGKTSLLGAGLMPKLRADCFRPVLLRLRYEKTDPPPLAQVRAALAAACADEAATAEALQARWGEATLWECCHRVGWQGLRLAAGPPVLLFDQFEEVFTLGKERRPPGEIAALAAQLADLIENRPPAAVQARLAEELDLANEFDFGHSPLRLVVTLRYDYLSHLEAWKTALPSLMRNRMALHPLRGPQACEAVVRPGRLDGRNLVSDAVGAQIVRLIARRAPDTPLEEIEAVPPLLSLLCDELNRARGEAPEITADLAERRHGDILHEFYRRCFDGLPPAARRYVEDELITAEGAHRNLAARQDAEVKLARTGVAAPAAAIDALLARRLLSAEEHGGTQRIEITHDVLTPLVAESRDKRLERERAERAEVERRAAQEQAARVEVEKRRLRRFAIIAGVAALLAVGGMLAGFLGVRRANEARVAADRARVAADEANHKSTTLLAEAARSDRLVAEEKLSVGDDVTAFAYLARAISYEPKSTLAAEKAVGALNTWRFSRQLALCVGHTEWVCDAVFSGDGRWIATTSGDGTSKVWDAQKGSQVATLRSNIGSIGGRARFSADGQRILTVHTMAATLWETQSGKEVAKLGRSVESAEFSTDGQWIVTAERHSARVWKSQSGEVLATLEGHTGVVTSAQFSVDGHRIVTASVDRTARVWETKTGKLLAVLNGHAGKVNCAEFSKDDQRIVTASEDETAKVWEVHSGRLLVTLSGHTESVASAQISADGQRIVTLSKDNTVRVWDAQSGKSLATLAGHTAAVSSAQISPDGQWIVTASMDLTARVWEAQNGKLAATLSGHLAPLTSAQFSADGQCIVTASYDKTARVWEAQSRKQVATLAGRNGRGSADGQWILTILGDNTAKVWEAQNGRPVATLVGHVGPLTAAQFSSDGRRIVTASSDKTAKIWETRRGNLAATLAGHTGGLRSAEFSANGQWIVTASSDKTARVWDGQSGQTVATLAGHADEVTNAIFSGDGKQIVTVSKDKTAKVWKTQRGELLVTLEGHSRPVDCVQISADGRRIVTGSGDGTAMLWEAQSGRPVGRLAGHIGSVSSAQFSLDGQRIVTTDRVAAYVWEAQSGRLLATLAGHVGRVVHAQFSADGERVVTASWDKTAKVWEVQNGKLVATLAGHDRMVLHAEFSADGRRIMTTSADDTVMTWRVLSTNSGPPPQWFREFLHFIAQRRLNSGGELEFIPLQEWLATRERLSVIRRSPVGADEAYRWLLDVFVPE